jgi:hypothetical protein
LIPTIAKPIRAGGGISANRNVVNANIQNNNVVRPVIRNPQQRTTNKGLFNSFQTLNLFFF